MCILIPKLSAILLILSKADFLISTGKTVPVEFLIPIGKQTLFEKGFKLFYSKEALAYHNHKLELNSYLLKMKLRGEIGRLFLKKHPELCGKIFPTKLPLKEKIRLEFWHLLYPLGIPLKNRKILFENYQRLCNLAIISGFNTH